MDTLSDTVEIPSMTIWPTVAATPLGRRLGQLFEIPLGIGSVFTIGKILVIATIPITLAIYAWQLLPFVCRRYSITSQRILIQKGLSAVEEKSLALEKFDAIRIEILPGQQWYHAGELVFEHKGRQVFRLSGVSRPEAFRQVCLEAHLAEKSVTEVLKKQMAVEASR